MVRFIIEFFSRIFTREISLCDFYECAFESEAIEDEKAIEEVAY